MDKLIVFWLVVTILFVLLELMTVGLTSIWFAAGAFVAFIMAMLGMGVAEQVIVFVLVSIVLLCLTKPWARKYINSNAQKTNIDSLIGEKTIITEDVDNLKQTGKAIVLGQEWTVRSEDDTQMLKEGDLAEIIRISGVKLIVRKIKED